MIKASKRATIDSLRQLQPVLNQLAASGDDFVKAFNVFLTYPFVDEVVGRDPQVARNLHMGDYTNLSITLDIDLTQGLPTPPGIPNLPCIPLSEIPETGPLPPLGELCEGAIQAINKCLQSPEPRELRRAAGVPHHPGVQPAARPRALPGRRRGHPRRAAAARSPSPACPALPGSRGWAAARTGPWNDAADGGPTMAQLQSVYDPALVNLLVPQLVTQALDEG